MCIQNWCVPLYKKLLKHKTYSHRVSYLELYLMNKYSQYYKSQLLRRGVDYQIVIKYHAILIANTMLQILHMRYHLTLLKCRIALLWLLSVKVLLCIFSLFPCIYHVSTLHYPVFSKNCILLYFLIFFKCLFPCISAVLF